MRRGNLYQRLSAHAASIVIACIRLRTAAPERIAGTTDASAATELSGFLVKVIAIELRDLYGSYTDADLMFYHEFR